MVAGKNQGRAGVIKDQQGPTRPIWVNTGVAANHHAQPPCQGQY
jgi:hypothetical protein